MGLGSASSGSVAPAGLLRLIGRIDARPKTAALVLAVVCALPILLTVQFFSDIHAGLTELLPKNAPSVRALDEIHKRLGAQARLIVIAQSPHAEANRRFITELGARLERRHVPEARTIQVGIREEGKWVRNHAPLLMPKAKFDSVMTQLEDAVKRAKLAANPLYVDVGGEDNATAWKRLDDELEAEARTNDRFPNGYFELPDGSRVIAMISLSGDETDLEPSDNLLRAVKEETAAIRGNYPADMEVGYNGDVANIVEEHAAILADLSLSSMIVFVLVGGVILIYFRSLRGLLAVLCGLAPGLLFTFAVGRLTVHHLNSNTAFLGSIIAGNGVNYPLLFLAYYRGQHPSVPRARAIYDAGRNALFGTLGAALAASAAYGGLAVSDFKGLSQFGWIGGMGMITTWLLTFLSMPIAICLLNPPRGGERASRTQAWLGAFFSKRVLSAAVAGVFVLSALTAAGFGVRYALRHGLYEMDLRALRNRDSQRFGAASWDGKVSEVFGVWLTPVVALVTDPSHREPVAAALRQHLVDGPDHVAERVETIDQLAPPKEEQEGRIERLQRFSKSLSHVPRSEIPERARPYLDAWLAPEALKPIALEDVPAPLKSGFTELSGRTDRMVALFPSLKINYNDARNVLHFADELNATPLPPDAVVGGTFLFMSELIRLVMHDAPEIVAVVALLVGLALAPFFLRRPARILLVVSTVACVALLAQAAMLAMGVQLNMLNFAAVPITIGVGSDYVVNLLGAMDALKLDARRACARMGGAIFLCSLTTVIGYVSLLIAQSGALRTFGWAAVLGEIMSVTTVLLVLPVLLARPVEDGVGPVAEPETAPGK
jgi:predicted RND superfamily exporter protein